MFVKYRFELDQYTKDLLADLEPKFGYSGFGEFVFYRTYSRIKKDGGQETWCDVVIRVIEGTFSIRKDFYLKNHIHWDEKEWQKIAKDMSISMFQMKWLPPGRGLWAMGTDFIYNKGGMALANCGYTGITDNYEDDLIWLMDSLMLGVGIGFSPFRNDNMKFKNPKGQFEHVIKDSREGWCESVKLLLQAYKYGASRPEFVYDEIRPSGLPIKGFGGISSGPDPLIYLHKLLEENMELYMTDKYYDSVIFKMDCANQIGCTIVSGNVRRSAELACLSITDPVFKNLKNYDLYPRRAEWGWMSNNSTDLEFNSDFELLAENAQRIIRNGEPGFKNLRNFPKGRIGKRDKVKKDKARGVNACFSPTLSKVITPDGIRSIKDVFVGSKIWTEYGWAKVSNKWSTGVNKVYKYDTTAGSFYGTDNHQIVWEGLKVEVKDAVGIDILLGPDPDKIKINNQDVMDGLVIADGGVAQNWMVLYIGDNDYDIREKLSAYIGGQCGTEGKGYKVHTTITNLPVTYERYVPNEFIEGNVNRICGFLRGIYSGNGSICGGRITLKASSKVVIEQVQLMLSSIGIPSYYTTNKATKVQFRNGIYECKQSYDLNIIRRQDLFVKHIGFVQEYKNIILEEILENKKKVSNSKIKGKRTYDIVSVELVAEEETFDITVDNLTHTLWSNCFNVSNCAEQILEHRETCIIDETCPTLCSSVDEWYEACKYATLYVSTVSLLPTHQCTTNSVVGRNRRVGVGIFDFTSWLHDLGMSRIIKCLRKGYKIVRKTNQFYNGEAGVPEAIRVTTVKPGGTVPKLTGKTSGVMYPNFHYMVRRVRVARNHCIANLLKEANVPYEADFFSQNTDVFEWPIQTNPDVKTAGEVSVWEQASNLVLLQREWSDNAVSNTLMFRPKWVLSHLFSHLNGDYEIEKLLEEWLNNTYGYDTHGFITSILHQKDTFEDSKFKIIIKWDDLFTEMTECKIYEFDPKHEEDSIESVLAAIAPLTKTVSMLPHTAKGVYQQMPESEITKEEYELRLSRIKPIDWSKLSGSEGQDERYCVGESCEIIKF